ncbi:2-dehydropantoate 2-reductase (EC [Lentimonas sp. CC19]|nr:2-dehydropantoate 2-reductase (EC [Lentimonas sp. CC19]CAA6693875.1 2-dehydropantoate 2-reductase (EC [Lentimonas sp. CC10]CAA7068627.1 2-dehydropantoate 2-reductase (EC [Lentimonas sp. CC11]
MSFLSSSTRCALVGPGAIGLYYGGLLAKAGASLHVLARSDAAALREDGITIRMVDPRSGELSETHSVRPSAIETDAAAIGAVDLVIISAKATVNCDLLPSLQHLVEPGRTTLLTLQNGMGNAELLAKHFPTNPVLASLCSVCVNRSAPGVVENYLPGRVEIGSLGERWPERAAEVVADFTAAGVKANFSPVLDAALWRKLCWNVPFNGLAIAAGGITTDLILADAGLAARARRLMAEVQAASALCGHEIADSFLQGQFDVTERMGAYRPSSLIDYLDGRAVEVEAIFGEPLRRGQALGLEMPELAQLHAELVTAVGAR